VFIRGSKPRLPFPAPPRPVLGLESPSFSKSEHQD